MHVQPEHKLKHLLLFSVPTLCTKILEKGHFHQEALSDPLSQRLLLSLFFAPESTDVWIPG